MERRQRDAGHAPAGPRCNVPDLSPSVIRAVQVKRRPWVDWARNRAALKRSLAAGQRAEGALLTASDRTILLRRVGGGPARPRENVPLASMLERRVPLRPHAVARKCGQSDKLCIPSIWRAAEACERIWPQFGTGPGPFMGQIAPPSSRKSPRPRFPTLLWRSMRGPADRASLRRSGAATRPMT